MKEVIAVIDPPQQGIKEYPDTQFTEIQFNVDSRNRSTWNGITENREVKRLKEAQVLEGLGYKIGEREQPLRAKWRKDGEDTEVLVLGIAGRTEGGQDLLKIEGQDTPVPGSQLEFMGREQVAEPVVPVSDESGGSAEVPSDSASEPHPPTGWSQDAPPPTSETGPHMGSRPAVSAEPPSVASLGREEDESYGTIPASERPGWRGRWDHIRAKLGGTILGAQVRAHNGAYRIYDKKHGGVHREVDEEEVREYQERERRAGGAAILGGLALFGTGILIGWLLHKNGQGNEYNEIIRSGRIPGDQLNQITDQIQGSQNSILDRIEGFQSANTAEHAELSDKIDDLQSSISEEHAELADELDDINNQNKADTGAGRNEGIDFESFNTDSFYGQTPQQTVRNIFDVIRDNNIEVRGLTSHKVDRIVNDMMQNHWEIASGMKTGNQQNIVDVASDWADGRTQNWQASGLQGMKKINGSTTESWQEFMRLATRHGVSFSR